MSSDLLLQVRGISKRLGKNQVLREVGFSIRSGEVLGLIGPNGAGKTTLFETLAGLLRADAGDVKLRGNPLPPAERKCRVLCAGRYLSLGGAVPGMGGYLF